MMTDHSIVGEYAARSALSAATELVDDDRLPEIVDWRTAEAAIDAVVKQVAAGASKRVWAAVFGAATAVLLVPEVQALLGHWAPIATAIVSALLAVLSKLTDARPAR
jgi:hypothetical protein